MHYDSEKARPRVTLSGRGGIRVEPKKPTFLYAIYSQTVCPIWRLLK